MENSLPAYYRTNDPVDNLLVKITLRKKNARDPAGELAMQSQATLGFTRTARSADAPLTSTGVFDVRDTSLESSNSFEFAWQQKVYGPRELLRYAAAIAQKRAGEPVTSVNTSSPAEMEHFRDVERRLDAGEPLFEVGPSGTLLYTMTDRDGYIPPSELNRELLSGSTPLSALPVLPPTLAGPLQEQWARLMQGTSYSGAGAQGIGAAVAQPLSDARGVFARAYKENPYRVMYICAAVGIDRDAFRARRVDTALHEVPLLAIRAYTPDAGGTITGGGTSLIEMRPGFTDYIPYDRASVVALTRTISGEAPVSGMAAALALAAADTVLGQGHYGGQIKLRPLSSVERGAMLTADGSAQADAQSRDALDRLSAAKSQEGNQLRFQLEQQRVALEGEIDGLKRQVAAALDDHAKTKDVFNQVQLQEEQHRLRGDQLSEEIAALKLAAEQARLQHAAELRVLEEQQASALQLLKEQNAHERRTLREEIDALKAVIGQKEREISDLISQNARANEEIVRGQQRFRETSAEKEYWHNKTQLAEKQKLVEKEAHQNYVDLLRRSHSKEIVTKESEKQTLRTLIVQKDLEAEEAKRSQIRAYTELEAAERQKRAKEIEAQLERQRAEEAERRRQLDLQVRESIHQREVETVTRSLSAEKERLQRELLLVNQEATSKAIEASEWRRNYHQLQASQYSPSKRY